MNGRRQKNTIIVLFGIYLTALIWIILFKMQLSIGSLGHFRSINMIPFASSVIVNGELSVSELVYNVLIFIPLGIYICMLMWNKPFLKKFTLIVAASLGLEVLQFILAVGASDITDLINNTAGGVMGVGIYGVFHMLFKEKTNKIVLIFALAGTIIMVLFIGMLLFVNS